MERNTDIKPVEQIKDIHSYKPKKSKYITEFFKKYAYFLADKK